MRKFLLILLSLLLVSCKKESGISIKDFNSIEEIDLCKFCDEEFDYILILDAGNYLNQIDIGELKLSPFEDKSWLGEKIYYVYRDKIVKQINVNYYISGPINDYGYISFFYSEKTSNTYIYRKADDTKFKVKLKQQLKNNSQCYYLE